MPHSSLTQASRRRPPQDGQGGGGVTVAATATGALAISPVPTSEDYWIEVACAEAFNINFGTSSVADPAARYVFPAGPQAFCIPKGITHFKVITENASTVQWWPSSPSAVG